MDSFNSFQAYSKVRDDEYRRETRRRLIRIAASAILLLIIVVGFTVWAVVSRNNGNSSRKSPSSSSSMTSTADPIKSVCNVTMYPDSCYSSISSVKGSNDTSDPIELFKLSLQVAMDALSKISSLPDNFSIPTNDKRVRVALQDCKELNHDAIDQLNTSLMSIQSTKGGKLSIGSKLDDLKAWLSAAITDQETCLDGFENTTGGIGEKIASAMVNSSQFTSNSLAITARFLGVLEKLSVPIHRKLLAISATDPNGSIPNPVKPDVTVAKDGTGQFKTIGEALDLVPVMNAKPFVIYIKKGVYNEKVVVDNTKWNVMMVGDGMYKTIVTGNQSSDDNGSTFSSASFAVTGRGFVARDMGFKNTAGPLKHQAVALRSGSDHSIFYRCSFDAYQDTLYVHSLRQFYRDCDITGTVDFIFGDASVVFQNCTIRPKQPLQNQQNTITAQGKTDPNENTGISIQGCTISPFENVTAPTYLGRPWKAYSTTVVMESKIGGLIDHQGWLPWNNDPVPDTLFYAEYQNSGPGSSLVGRVNWAGYRPMISSLVAKKFAVDSFIQGTSWISGAGVDFASNL